MAGAQDVPRTDDGSPETGKLERMLGLTTRLLIGLHDRGGLRDAYIDEVASAGGGGRGNRFGCRSEVDVDELLRLGRRGVRHAQELEEGVARGDRVDKRRTVEWIGDDGLAVCRR